ncbi:MAG: CDP-alcohol phosphatidyltransferase family protein [Verrucomicrobiae bacterium]|nr:CDP-alcohol phosphatidyltransferase family protein [Verrucomicrobiae bacterium]NNJ42535.1 CDP-alcohol phosphatidyltransferase family protein [Akkermansiaceae bacterium]
MNTKKTYSYNDFWQMHGRQSIWVTRNVSYRFGAVLALLASKMGVTPNMISILSASITVISACLVIGMGQESWLAGVILIVGLQLGYAFDCADGPLARATGQGSSFGSLSDKMADLSSGMIFPCALAYGTDGYHVMVGSTPISMGLGLLTLFLTARATLCVLMWLKESVIHKSDRLREDKRRKNLWWRLKKTMSLYIDEPIYRLAIALAWCAGLFWEFIMIYGAGIALITFVYIVSSKKEMDAMDREKVLRS